ncbi:nuclear matrix constituent protein 1-like [Nicotiana tomentosiformis]|uniref:nuclear matrix constituent protein 1-like n=1 Tax=Nicotiana tomentosiformis TaxID=4098 RepID=UPI00388C9CCE
MIQNSVEDSIIIECETTKESWEKLKMEYQESYRVRQMQILNLKRDFESLRKQEKETITRYSSRISFIVIRIRLLGKDFKANQIVEKKLLSALKAQEQRRAFRQEMITEELVSSLQAQEQRRAFRQEMVTEDSIIVECETAKESWKKLKMEYQESGRVKQMQILNLKRDFESLRLHEKETITKLVSSLQAQEQRRAFRQEMVTEDSIIVECETAKESWEKLKMEYQESGRVRQMKILNLKRDFESLRMHEKETITSYSSSISFIVNRIRLLGKDFKANRIVEKYSCDELVSSLQAQEQRRAFRQEMVTEDALYAQNKKEKVC